MSCEDIPSLLDLQKVKKHAEDFGRLMGTGTGTSTNEVTGQVRPTYNSVMANLGYTRVGTFSTGVTLLNSRQTLLWDIADGGDGQEYSWSGTFPPAGKVVPPASTPASTGGIAIGAWMSRFDPELRAQTHELQKRSYSSSGFNVVGTFSGGFTIVDGNDIGIDDATGKGYTGPAGPVAPGTQPTTPPFTDVSGVSPHSAIKCTTSKEVQDIINASPSVDVDVFLDSVSIGQQIVIPKGKHVRFFGTATVLIDNAIYYKPTSVSNAALFYPVEFVSGRIHNGSSGMHSVHVVVPWQNAKRPLVVHDGFRFDCDNGGIAFRLEGGMFHKFGGEHRINSGSYFAHIDCSLQDTLGASAPACPMNVEFSCCLIGSGEMFKYTKTDGTPWNAGEGFFLTSSFHAQSVKILGQQINAFIVKARMLESASLVMDSCINSVFAPEYADRNTDGDWILKVKTTKGDSFSLAISPKVVQGVRHTGDMIIFSDENKKAGSILYGVSHSGGVIQGGGPTVDTAGVRFDYKGMRNYVLDSSVEFSSMATPLRFVKPINRSTIHQFEARDVGAYALGLPSSFPGEWFGYYNRFDSLYTEVAFNWLIPTYVGNGVSESIAMQLFPYVSCMQRAPIVSAIPSSTEPAVNGPTLSILSYENGAEVSFVKSASMTSPARTGWFGKLVCNATQYIAPR